MLTAFYTLAYLFNSLSLSLYCMTSCLFKQLPEDLLELSHLWLSFWASDVAVNEIYWRAHTKQQQQLTNGPIKLVPTLSIILKARSSYTIIDKRMRKYSALYTNDRVRKLLSFTWIWDWRISMATACSRSRCWRSCLVIKSMIATTTTIPYISISFTLCSAS